MLSDRFVEFKAGTDIAKGLKFTGKTYGQAAEDWAAKNIYDKTAARIQNIGKATAVIPEEGLGKPTSSRPLPSLSEIQGIRKFEFIIDENNSALKTAVGQQIRRLQANYPKYQFTVTYRNANPGG